MRTHSFIPPVAMAVLVAVASYVLAQSLPAPASAPGVQPAQIAGTVHSISLPQIPPPAFPDIPGKDKVEISCSTCHTLRYVTMQPRFSKKVWNDEVLKMINTYKAQIPQDQVNDIVTYLAAAHGVPDTQPGR